MYIFLSECLSVPKDLANRWTEMGLLYSVASHRLWEERVDLLPSPQLPLEDLKGVAASF